MIMRALLIASLAIFMLTGCGPETEDPEVVSTPAQDESIEREMRTERQKAKARAELRREYMARDSSRLVNFYLIRDTSDWDALKQYLIQESRRVEQDKPYVNEVILLGVDDTAGMTKIAMDADSIWKDEYNEYRVCALDNQTGEWRFCYGSMGGDAGGVGNWKYIMPLEEDIN